jgi:NTE family protein
MLHSLASRGIAADMVVGSSVGALNGAYYAGNPTIEGIQRLDTIWRGLRRSDVFPLTWRTILGFLYRPDFLVTSDALRQLVEENLGYRNLEDAKLPVHIVATDILSGGTVVMSEGPAAQAIIASAAVPAAFEPVHFNDLYLADGAVSSNTPVTVAVPVAQRLIVLPPVTPALSEAAAEAVANAFTLTLLIARQLVTSCRVSITASIICCAATVSATGSPYDFRRRAS